jgi:hypothetical protein
MSDKNPRRVERCGWPRRSCEVSSWVMKTKEGQRRAEVLDFKRRGADHDQFTVPSAASVCLKIRLQGTANRNELQPSAALGRLHRLHLILAKACGAAVGGRAQNFLRGGCAASPLPLRNPETVHRGGAVQGRDCRYGRQRCMQHS